MADSAIVPSSTFCADIQTASGQEINLCYQCKKCAAGCPMSFVMRPMNSDIVKLTQLGQREAVFNSNALWTCVDCKTCGARCPNGIDISRIMDALRQQTIEKQLAVSDNKTPAFHQAFMTSVSQLGRIFEAGVIGLYKFKSATYTQDLALGVKFLLKQKLRLLPERVKNMRQIQQIFQKAKEERP